VEAGAPEESFVDVMLLVSERDLDDCDGSGRGAEDDPDSLEPELPMPPVLLRLHPTKVTSNAVATNKCFFIFISLFVSRQAVLSETGKPRIEAGFIQ
jgi:hypothetical protein